MADFEISEFDNDDDQPDPADSPHADDTEDVALQKLVRRMSRIMGVNAEELMPGLRRLVVAEQLRQEDQRGAFQHCRI